MGSCSEANDIIPLANKPVRMGALGFWLLSCSSGQSLRVHLRGNRNQLALAYEQNLEVCGETSRENQSETEQAIHTTNT